MVTDFYHPHVGGVEVVVRNLAHELAVRGHELAVATVRTDGLPWYEEDGAVRIYRIRCTTARLAALFSQRRLWAPPVPDPEAIDALRRVVDAERPQIVHGHDWLARSFLPIRSSSRARFVVSLHYYTVSCAKKSLMYRNAPCTGPRLAKCLRCASAHYGVAKGSAVTLGNFLFAGGERRAVDLYIPVSEATAAGNGLVGSGLEYEVIPNFVPRDRSSDGDASPLVDALPQPGFLLFVGDLRREKGIDVLLEAYRGLRGAPPLVLIGKVWPDSPRVLPPNVHLLTGWGNEAVREAQRRCLALVAPSVWPEPFGMVVVETLAAGRPIIASRVGGMAELVVDGVDGLLVPPADVGALRSAIASLLDDERLVARMAERASRAADRFGAEEIVPRVERAYERVLDDQARAHARRRPAR